MSFQNLEVNLVNFYLSRFANAVCCAATLYLWVIIFNTVGP